MMIFVSMSFPELVGSLDFSLFDDIGIVAVVESTPVSFIISIGHGGHVGWLHIDRWFLANLVENLGWWRLLFLA